VYTTIDTMESPRKTPACASMPRVVVPTDDGHTGGSLCVCVMSPYKVSLLYFFIITSKVFFSIENRVEKEVFSPFFCCVCVCMGTRLARSA
jgi:hypothetical protein